MLWINLALTKRNSLQARTCLEGEEVAEYLEDLEVLVSHLVLWPKLLAGIALLVLVFWARYRSYQQADPEQFVMRPMFKKWAAIIFVAMLVAWAVFLILLDRGVFR